MEDWSDAAYCAAWDQSAQHSHTRRAEQLTQLLSILAASKARRILDLGIGSGLVAEAILARLPDARVLGVDGSAPMLALARQRLSGVDARVQLLEMPFDAITQEHLAPLRIDAVVSVLALHHVEDDEKRRLFSLVRNVLPVGGMLLLIDRLYVDYRAAEPLFAPVFSLLGESLSGSAPPSYAAYADARTAQREDFPASLTDHLQWLDQAGFDAATISVGLDRAFVGALRR